MHGSNHQIYVIPEQCATNTFKNILESIMPPPPPELIFSLCAVLISVPFFYISYKLAESQNYPLQQIYYLISGVLILALIVNMGALVYMICFLGL